MPPLPRELPGAPPFLAPTPAHIVFRAIRGIGFRGLSPSRPFTLPAPAIVFNSNVRLKPLLSCRLKSVFMAETNAEPEISRNSTKQSLASSSNARRLRSAGGSKCIDKGPSLLVASRSIRVGSHAPSQASIRVEHPSESCVHPSQPQVDAQRSVGARA